jgi:hypothetical protein
VVVFFCRVFEDGEGGGSVVDCLCSRCRCGLGVRKRDGEGGGRGETGRGERRSTRGKKGEAGWRSDEVGEDDLLHFDRQDASDSQHESCF